LLHRLPDWHDDFRAIANLPKKWTSVNLSWRIPKQFEIEVKPLLEKKIC
jgi:hypothetical protein